MKTFFEKTFNHTTMQNANMKENHARIGHLNYGSPFIVEKSAKRGHGPNHFFEKVGKSSRTTKVMVPKNKCIISN